MTNGSPLRSDVRFEFLDVRAEENEGGQSGGRDRVTFGHGLHRVADRVEFVGHGAHFLRQIAHHRDAAGVVGDRSERIERDDDSRHRQHRHHRDRDSVKTGEMKTEQNRDADETDRQRSCMLADRQSGDDVRGVAGFRRARDFLHRRDNASTCSNS